MTGQTPERSKRTYPVFLKNQMVIRMFGGRGVRQTKAESEPVIESLQGLGSFERMLVYDGGSYVPTHVPTEPDVVSGIYFLFHNGALTYVGQSKNCRDRIAKHRANGRPFDFATIMPVSSERRSAVEAAIIHKFAPSGNVVGKPVPQAKATKPRAWARAVAEARLNGLAGPAVKPYVPDPNDLRTVTRPQAREIARECGLLGTIIEAAISDGRLEFFAGNRTGKGGAPIVVALYQTVMAFCQAERRAELDRAGIRFEPLPPIPVSSSTTAEQGA